MDENNKLATLVTQKKEGMYLREQIHHEIVSSEKSNLACLQIAGSDNSGNMRQTPMGKICTKPG
jgi:hypothetical protein